MKFAALAISFSIPLAAIAAEERARVELNAIESADQRCRVTFVIENKSTALDSLKLDLVFFRTDGSIERRLATELGPIRATKTMVRTFAPEGECKQIGAVLVNDVTGCAPDNPTACLDGLALSSRVNGVRFYK